MSLRARLGVTRGDFTLDVDLDLEPGAILAVIGPNGAGKTTVLRALAGLQPLSHGRIEVAGQVWDDPEAGVFRPAVQRSASLVFQDYRLFPHLSVLDNLAFAHRAKGAGRRAARTHAGAVLERLGLVELGPRRPAQLSGGQAQRVALARALAADPALLLLDEPLAALDARTRLQVRTELRRYLSEFTGPCVLVTHDPVEAMVLADQIVVIERGRVVQSGTPAFVARHPASEYVARLVGLNLYPGVLGPDGRVELDDGGVLVAAGSWPLVSGADPGLVPAPAQVGQPVLVALAPSAISLFTTAPQTGSARNTWSGTVGGLELLADRVRVSVDGVPSALVDITPAALADLGLVGGQRVWLSAKATEILAYPAPG